VGATREAIRIGSHRFTRRRADNDANCYNAFTTRTTRMLLTTRGIMRGIRKGGTTKQPDGICLGLGEGREKEAEKETAKSPRGA